MENSKVLSGLFTASKISTLVISVTLSVLFSLTANAAFVGNNILLLDWVDGNSNSTPETDEFSQIYGFDLGFDTSPFHNGQFLVTLDEPSATIFSGVFYDYIDLPDDYELFGFEEAVEFIEEPPFTEVTVGFNILLLDWIDTNGNTVPDNLEFSQVAGLGKLFDGSPFEDGQFLVALIDTLLVGGAFFSELILPDSFDVGSGFVGDLSSIETSIIGEVPVPASLFLYGSALLGFGLKRIYR